MIFEWDSDKAKINQQRHNISFEEAKSAFDDENLVDALDESHSEDELRFNLIGLTEKGLLFVVYTERGDEVIRIISARQADKFEEEIYVEK
ncbi:MAG: BrnT family toxin [Pyrinomonadaceae bacterium]|nr:BrnT family toxin [Pyrinomonadaceae bacterium]